MKTRLERKQIFILLVVLTLVQFACNLGAQASSNSAQPTTQPPASTSVPQATQPQATQAVAATKSGRGTLPRRKPCFSWQSSIIKRRTRPGAEGFYKPGGAVL